MCSDETDEHTPFCETDNYNAMVVVALDIEHVSVVANIIHSIFNSPSGSAPPQSLSRQKLFGVRVILQADFCCFCSYHNRFITSISKCFLRYFFAVSSLRERRNSEADASKILCNSVLETDKYPTYMVSTQIGH